MKILLIQNGSIVQAISNTPAFDSNNLKLAAQMGEKFDKISQQKQRGDI